MREAIFYSDLEYDHWVTVELDPNVATYCEQPREKEISYVYGGELHSTLIDMWLLLKDGTEEYREVKYRDELEPGHKNYERNMRQIGAQKVWCKMNGFVHRVIDETMIRTSRHVLGNRVKVLGYVNNIKFDDKFTDILDFIKDDRTSLRHLMQETRLSIYQLQTACSWLTYKGLLNMDLESCPFSLQTEVWKRE